MLTTVHYCKACMRLSVALCMAATAAQHSLMILSVKDSLRKRLLHAALPAGGAGLAW